MFTLLTLHLQIVSAKTKSVGCGVTWCKKLYAVEHFDSGYFVVCHYGPALVPLSMSIRD